MPASGPTCLRDLSAGWKDRIDCGRKIMNEWISKFIKCIDKLNAAKHRIASLEMELDAMNNAHRSMAEDMACLGREREESNKRIAELESILNTPETDDFFKGVPLEAAHQRLRWPSEQDAGKMPADWFWLVGY